MPSPGASMASVNNALRRFRRNRRGSAAVEFALVAPVFLALLFAIIETAIVFFANQVLETITQDSARIVQTGQAQAAKYNKEDFKKEIVCTRPLANLLFNCMSGVYVDVQSYSAFSSVVITDPIDAARNFTDSMKYCPGNDGEIVVVRMFYQWPLFVTGLGYNIANLSGSKRLLIATAAFRNEPFSTPPSVCS
jgi:Flp pilus assembly protein TadG